MTVREVVVSDPPAYSGADFKAHSNPNGRECDVVCPHAGSFGEIGWSIGNRVEDPGFVRPPTPETNYADPAGYRDSLLNWRTVSARLRRLRELVSQPTEKIPKGLEFYSKKR